MNGSRLIWFLAAVALAQVGSATTFYVSGFNGDDANNGMSAEAPLQSIQALNDMEFVPGDSILFHAGESWQGMFWLHGSGTPEFPIVVGKYGEGPRPILDGNGYQASLLIYNDECIAVQDLEFTNDASHLDEVGEVKKLEGFGGESNDWGSGKNVRFGIKVVADAQSIQRIQFANLYIHDVFPSPDLAANEHKGYAIKIETQSDLEQNAVRLANEVSFSNLTVTRTGHYGIWIKSLGLNQNDTFKNQSVLMDSCLFEYTGGSGFVPNKCEFVTVQNSIFNHTGSDVDERMWKRGSGMWTFDCRNVMVQFNQFKNAHGPIDSYGAHIDYGNENVLYQNNLSYNNEGGFVEILGDNINCGYRYSLSINDGYRVDPEGLHNGRTLNISDYCGETNPGCSSSGTFVYNNTIYIGDTLAPEVRIKPGIGDFHCYNNLFVCESEGGDLLCDVSEESNELDFSNNLFFDASRYEFDSGGIVTNGGVFAHPLLQSMDSLGGLDEDFYKLTAESSAFESGLIVSEWLLSTASFDHTSMDDFYGNSVQEIVPSIGAHQPRVGSFFCGPGAEWNHAEQKCTACMCDGDFDGDGNLTVADLLIFISNFGGN
jgi:hypothetical protein